MIALSSGNIIANSEVSLTESKSSRIIDIRFSFEEFLEDVEEELPEGLDSDYFALLPAIQNPLRNIRKLPRAFLTLPINAFLFQPLFTILKTYLIPVTLSLPLVILSLFASSFYGSLGNGIIFFILTLFGVLVTPVYMKHMYNTFSQMIELNQAPWLIEPIEKPFNNYYHGKWPRIYLILSALLPIILDIQILVSDLFTYVNSIYYQITIVLLILIGHVGTSFVLYFNIMSIYFVQINTSLYQTLLGKITNRVVGYNEGHESILTKNTYEVVKVLSDTPGLSVQSLGNIPVFGFLASIFIINGIIFLLGGPILTEVIQDFANGARDAALAQNKEIIANIIAVINDPTQEITTESFQDPDNAFFGAKEQIFNIILGIAMVISLIVSFARVIWPILAISRVMGKFKRKALGELDPFIYGEITNVALEKTGKAKLEGDTQMLFILRQYIYSMKPSPVNPFIILQYSFLFLIYFTRVLPFIVRIFSGGVDL